MAKKQTKAPIVALEQDVYERSFGQLVHFSFKVVNSNTPPGGIRLAREEVQDTFPYVSVSGLLAQEHPIDLDYASMTPPAIATHLKHLRIAQGRDDRETITNPEVVIRSAEAATSGRLELGTDSVEPRLRQILLPRDHAFDEYVSVTPLASAGLCAVVSESAKAIGNGPEEDQRRRIPRAVLTIGGSNTQNVGSLVRQMQRPLFFSAPRQDPELKRAMSLFYNGMRFLLPRELMGSYIDWRANQLMLNEGRMSGKLRVRQQEKTHVRSILQRVLKQADHCITLLERHQEKLPLETMAENLDRIQLGLLNHSQRDRDWKEAFSHLLAGRIAEFQINDGRTLGLDASGVRGIASMIEDLLP
jgi:hypothetical protein